MRTWLAVSLVLVVGLFPWSAPGVERGITEYSNGAQNFFSGVLPPPPPGFYFKYNFVYYQANKFAGVPVPARFEAVGNALNLTYVSNLHFFGANVAASASVPLTYFSYSLSPDQVMNDNHIRGMLRFVKDKTWTVERVKALVAGVVRVRDLARVVGPEIRKLMSDYQTGVGNSTITPIVLGWHFNDFHVTPSFTVLIPGTYHRTSLASPAQNYFTFMPSLGLSWMPKNTGLEMNLVLMYDFPTNNTNPLIPSKDFYQSGQAVHFDYCVNYVLLPYLRLGGAGYYYQQTTGDVRDGKDIGNHGRVFAIGPALQYNPSRNLTLQLVNQWEMAARNMPEGVRVWFNVQYGF